MWKSIVDKYYTISRCFSNMSNRNRRTFGIILLIICVIFWTNVVIELDSAHRGHVLVTSENILYENVSYFTVLDKKEVARKNSPTILLYSTFFGEMKWYEESKHVFSSVCNNSCTLTNNKSQISIADAIVFHLADITWQGQALTGFKFSFPTYRSADQVWILYNLEPMTMIWGDMTAWQGLFNWTMSYMRSSDVYTPYGIARKLTDAQISDKPNDKTLKNFDFFGAKSQEGAIAVISHCTDDARRYRVIGELKKYLNVKVFGRCGDVCPDGYQSCNKLLGDYKFYIAFENSDCNDYVSEKYWRSLIREQIPLVAWKLNMDGIVIPGSYINVYDFANIEAAGRYIANVGRNRTLYNSYFRWRFTHTLENTNGWCNLCDTLRKAQMPRKVYHDMHGWLTNSTCEPLTLFKLFSRKLDRFLYSAT